jgi:hypothetical protein
MPRIAIVQNVRLQVDNPHSRKISYSLCRPLPICYMSDYSVLGLFVDHLESAMEVLRKEGVATTDEAFGAEITLSDRNELPGLVQRLSRSGIYCTIGDVIDSIYQG